MAKRSTKWGPNSRSRMVNAAGSKVQSVDSFSLDRRSAHALNADDTCSTLSSTSISVHSWCSSRYSSIRTSEREDWALMTPSATMESVRRRGMVPRGMMCRKGPERPSDGTQLQHIDVEAASEGAVVTTRFQEVPQDGSLAKPARIRVELQRSCAGPDGPTGRAVGLEAQRPGQLALGLVAEAIVSAAGVPVGECRKEAAQAKAGGGDREGG